MIAALLPILSNVIGKVADKFFPNPEDEMKRQSLQNEFTLRVMEQASSIERSAAEIVKTEAASSHWLAANWRPITMLTFVALIVARWFGWAAPNLAEAEYLALWDIVQIGLGGYVVGRSAEKVVPAIAAAMKKG